MAIQSLPNLIKGSDASINLFACFVTGTLGLLAGYDQGYPGTGLLLGLGVSASFILFVSMVQKCEQYCSGKPPSP